MKARVIMTENSELSVFKKIVSVFWEPSATFASLIVRTTWIDIVIPLLIVIVISLVTMPYITPIAVQYQKDRIEKNEKMTDEQKTAVLDRLDQQSVSIITYISTPIAVAVKALVFAAVLWFIGNFLLGGESKFLVIFALTAYVSLIDLASMAVKYPLIISQQSIQIYTSPAMFFEESKSFLFRFMTTLDIFAIWKVILSAIGLSVIYQKKTSKCFSVLIVFWLIYCVVVSVLGGLFY